MKKAYQSKEGSAARQPQAERAVQIALPMAEVLTSLEEGLGELVRKVGRMFIESVLEAEVEQIAGPKQKPNACQEVVWWGGQRGYLCRSAVASFYSPR